jgi:hypothetical protein
LPRNVNRLRQPATILERVRISAAVGGL